MKRKPEWIEKTKKEIDQVLDSVELDPNGWEQGFLQSIKKQLDKKGTLTDGTRRINSSLSYNVHESGVMTEGSFDL